MTRKLTIEELAQLCDLSVSIVKRALASLVKRGLIEELEQHLTPKTIDKIEGVHDVRAPLASTLH